MSDLASVFRKNNDVEINEDASVDENTLNNLGQNDNYLKDLSDTNTAARTSADSTTAATLSSMRTQLNTFTSIHKLISSGTLSSGVEPIQDNYFIDVRFRKNTTSSESFVSLHISRYTSAGAAANIGIQFETEANMGLTPSQWDYAYWIWDAENDRIEWYVFKDVSVAIP